MANSVWHKQRKFCFSTHVISHMLCSSDERRTTLHERREFYTYRPSATFTAFPISAGFFTTLKPAASGAFIFYAAVPLPPEMMAPAWPIRRPRGALIPAIELTT